MIFDTEMPAVNPFLPTMFFFLFPMIQAPCQFGSHYQQPVVLSIFKSVGMTFESHGLMTYKHMHEPQDVALLLARTINVPLAANLMTIKKS